MSRCLRPTPVTFPTRVFCEIVYTHLTFEYLIECLLSGYLLPLVVWNNEICIYSSCFQLFSVYHFVEISVFTCIFYCFVHLISKVSFELVVLSDQFKSFNYNLLTCLTTLKHSNLWPTRFDKSFCSLRWSFFLSTPRLLRHARFLCSKINIEFLTSIVLCKIISFDITRSPMYRVVVLACLGFQMVSVFPNKIICLPIDGYVSIQASNIALTT